MTGNHHMRAWALVWGRYGTTLRGTSCTEEQMFRFPGHELQFPGLACLYNGGGPLLVWPPPRRLGHPRFDPLRNVFHRPEGHVARALLSVGAFRHLPPPCWRSVHLALLRADAAEQFALASRPSALRQPVGGGAGTCRIRNRRGACGTPRDLRDSERETGLHRTCPDDRRERAAALRLSTAADFKLRHYPI